MVSENIPVGQLGCMGAGGAICTYYYLHDGLGSTMALVDSTGAVKNTYSYDPWGNSTGVTGNAPNPFRYVGAMLDSTGLRKMGERYYDPSIGRFTQLDPAGGRYGYVDGNPVNFVDPSGLGKHHKKAKKHKPKSVVFLPPTATPTSYIPMFPTYYPTSPPGPQEHAPTPPQTNMPPRALTTERRSAPLTGSPWIKQMRRDWTGRRHPPQLTFLV